MSSLKDMRDLIRELAELLDSTSLSEIEVEGDDVRIRVARQLAPVSAAPMVQMHQPAQVPSGQAAPAAAMAASAEPAIKAAPADPKDHPGCLLSPMVGTVYLSPEPGAPQFVKPGDRVSAGDTLLIIEAMKVMNAIPAPKDGTVVRILVADSQPVEFDEPLVIIE